MSTGKLYGILSDVHGNQEAFFSVLEYMKGLSVEEIYCLGDLVGYGAGGAECVQLARKYDVHCIQGNHDAQIRPPRDPRMRAEAIQALDIALEHMEPDDLDWLQSLPDHMVVDDHMVLVHGALTGRDDYILNQDAVNKNLKILKDDYAGIHLCFFGHSHLAMVLGAGQTRTKFPESSVIDLEPGRNYLINPGSVGQPRDGNPQSSFVVYDPDQSQVMLLRLEYDIRIEQKRMQKAGLPEKLWRRIEVGK